MQDAQPQKPVPLLEQARKLETDLAQRGMYEHARIVERMSAAMVTMARQVETMEKRLTALEEEFEEQKEAEEEHERDGMGR